MAIGIMISHIVLNLVKPMSGIGEYLRLLLASLGGVGVAVFFTLSGYGCYYSVRKKAYDVKSSCKWGGQKILRMLVVFVLCFVSVGIIYFINGERNFISDILRLSMPFQTTWYFKIQLCFYIYMSVSLIVARRPLYRFSVILLLSLAMIIVLRVLGYLTFWWDTAFCFPMGFLLAHLHTDKTINKIYAHRISLIITLLALPVSFLFTQINCYWAMKVLANAVFGLAFVIIFSVCFSSFFIGKIGERSLEIYLLHVGLIHLFFKQKKTVSVFYIALFIVVSCIMAWLIYCGQKWIFKEK